MVVCRSLSGENKRVNNDLSVKGTSKNCGLLFTRNDRVQTYQNRFVWFKKWVFRSALYMKLMKILCELCAKLCGICGYHFTTKDTKTLPKRTLKIEVSYRLFASLPGACLSKSLFA